ncbi:hypothetical protein LTR36_010313 [Oleoguttula mirabilis]|uniref:Uncharacterized protein n=1 Tax=Oleoguttula mirabilis TaxID=1507867 RepID=A0AAV9J4T2_9PEZI|nr:hypothetical protein LTR36_010313 [Oleoguttula mirabilis]
MGRAIKPSGKKKQSNPSLAVAVAQQQKTAIRAGQIPDDIGLLPDTFIMPRGKNRPSWFSNFGGRWRMERKRMRIRMQELLSTIMYRFFMVRPRPRLQIRSIPGIAKDLQKQMYTLFASGNLAPIESRICEGLLGSLRSRIGQRPPNTALRWTLHKYLSRPKVASYRAAIMPAQKGETSSEKNGAVQAVVRIHSLQSLQHVKRVSTRDAAGHIAVREVVVDAQGREVAPVAEGEVPKDAKESVEYLVVQKSLRRSREGPWMIWGTAEETTLEKIRREDKKDSSQGLVAKPAS